jgi:hypothetical protein
MRFSYGYEFTEHPVPYAGYTPYAYTVARRPTRIEIVHEPYDVTRPFERTDSLTDLITKDPVPRGSDPFELSEGRAHTQLLQMDALLRHLAARNAIHDRIWTGLDYEECKLRCRLDDLKTGTAYRGQSGKFESDIMKQLDRLGSERRAEEVSCWRDTGRILSDICDRWTEHADQKRKTRMMGLDL